MVTLCGIYGFRTFFRDGWLQKILSWQRPNGCYSFRYPNTSKYETLNPNSVDYFQQQPQYPSSGDMNQVIDDEQAQIDSIREALLDSEQRQQIFDLTAEESKQSVPPTEVTHQSPSELILPTADEGQNLQALLQDFRQQYEYKPSLLEPNEFQGASQGGVRTDEGSSSSSGETAYGVRVYSPEDRREFRENMRSKLGLPDKFNTTLTQLTHIVAHKDRRSSSSTSTSLGVPQQQQQNHHHHRWYHVAASGGRRAKREETLMDEGCMSHATALGVDSLSLHLRYILEDIYANDLMNADKIITFFNGCTGDGAADCQATDAAARPKVAVSYPARMRMAREGEGEASQSLGSNLDVVVHLEEPFSLVQSKIPEEAQKLLVSRKTPGEHRARRSPLLRMPPPIAATKYAEEDHRR
ncbi:unnamed protein product [Notodromas monacha]|uniref:Uncharacterized protein n=1 Tax=Notodromas monacha TaxID=399045 RepID=A0A7R9BJT1_9CRUS|nr:unnamed protein product [Notodromas monacha]CAG0916541.1 unnamed protein product [Notodromas monacha]